MKHFSDYHEDQFDFHAYCLRKVTLRAYIDVLRFEDRLYGEDYYFQAAEGIIGIYLHLHDNPDLVKEDEEPDYSKMTAAERKKAKGIARKKKKAAEKKEADQREKEAAAQNGNKDSKKGPKQGTDVPEEDPDGEELLKKDALAESQKYASIVTKFAPQRFQTWILQYDVAIRRKKYLLALQALFRAHELDSEHCEYISRLVDFATKMKEFGDLPSAVTTIIKEETPRLLEKKTVEQYLASVAESVKNSGASSNLATRTAVAKALVETKAGSVADASALILNGGISSKGATVVACQEASSVLKGFGASASSSTEKWISQVKERYPLLQDI